MYCLYINSIITKYISLKIDVTATTSRNIMVVPCNVYIKNKKMYRKSQFAHYFKLQILQRLDLLIKNMHFIHILKNIRGYKL